MPAPKGYKRTPATEFYRRAHHVSALGVVRRIMKLDELTSFNSLTEKQIKNLRGHPILAMPIVTTQERKDYMEYLSQFDWSDAWEFTPEVKPDENMTGKYLIAWVLAIMYHVRGDIEERFATQMKRIQGKDTHIFPTIKRMW